MADKIKTAHLTLLLDLLYFLELGHNVLTQSNQSFMQGTGAFHFGCEKRR